MKPRGKIEKALSEAFSILFSSSVSTTYKLFQYSSLVCSEITQLAFQVGSAIIFD